MQSDDEVVADLLVRWDELRERGQVVGPEELAPNSPHLHPELARRIAALGAMDWIDRTAGPVEVTLVEVGNGLPAGARRLGGRYRLDKLIAQGGSGQVWQGYDEELQRAVAVKVPRRAGATPRPPLDFLAEGRRVARLDHPGIVAVYDVGQQDGKYFIVSKLVPGESVADRLQGAGFAPAVAARLVAGVARSLHYAHRQGFVHRDIKPANILLDADGEPHLTDFGIAVTAVELLSASSSGTLAYMSPEQLAGVAQRFDHRTDIYSLGVVLFEMLTGRQPFHDDDPVTVRDRILDGVSAPPSAACPAVPPALDAACLRCLARDPADRYPDAEALATALEDFLAEKPVGKARRLRTAVVTLVALVAVTVALAYLPALFLKVEPGDTGRVAALDIAAAAENRAVAARVLALGGKVYLATTLGGPVAHEVAAAADLPAGAFLVEGVWLENTLASDDDLRCLSGLEGLARVYLARTRVTDAGLAHLASLPRLRQVGLDAAPVRGWGLKHLANQKRLTHLWINHTAVTDADLDHVAGMSELQVLGLAETKVTDAGLTRLSGLTALRQLNLDAARVSDLRPLSSLARLEELILRNATVTDESLGHVAAVTTLRGLWLENTHVTDAGVQKLRPLVNLRRLNLQNAKSGDGAVETAGGLTELRELCLDRTGATRLEPLKHLLRLEVVYFRHTAVTDGEMAWLGALPNLTEVWAGDTKVSDAGLRLLTGSPRLRMIDVNNTVVTDAGLTALAGIKTLREVQVSGSPATAEGVRKLRVAVPNCRVTGP